ncbi:ECF transporter S component [Oscillospiraceae bacterium OttesenSCG-928-G22]|nr:ECF transporter S component [Oscillospiraceae bacterium OttesenSCG-928-G22]
MTQTGSASRRSKNKVETLVKLGVLSAIILILALSPLGYMPLGAMRITIVQIPVIIGACLLGPLSGGVLGLVFGLTSLYLAPTDPVFAAILNINPVMMAVICIVPRVLVGVVAGHVSRLLNRFDRTGLIAYGAAGAAGSAVNTLLVLGSIFVFFGELAAGVFGVETAAVGAVILGIGVANGVPEIIASTLLVAAITKALAAFEKSRERRR